MTDCITGSEYDLRYQRPGRGVACPRCDYPLVVMAWDSGLVHASCHRCAWRWDGSHREWAARQVVDESAELPSAFDLQAGPATYANNYLTYLKLYGGPTATNTTDHLTLQAPSPASPRDAACPSCGHAGPTATVFARSKVLRCAACGYARDGVEMDHVRYIVWVEGSEYGLCYVPGEGWEVTDECSNVIERSDPRRADLIARVKAWRKERRAESGRP